MKLDIITFKSFKLNELKDLVNDFINKNHIVKGDIINMSYEQSEGYEHCEYRVVLVYICSRTSVTNSRIK